MAEMEQEGVEYMLFLKQNASELRKLGSDWDMTEEEINHCINEALLQVKDQSEIRGNTTKNWARKIWSYILFMVKVPFYTAVVIFSLFGLVMIMSTVHEPTDHLISKTLQPYSYDIFRFMRLVTLPVHRIANITSYYDLECLISNPFYTEPGSDCLGCVNIKTVKEVNTLEFDPAKFTTYINIMKPVLFKKSLTKPVTYEGLRESYLNHTQDYDDGLYWFHSSSSEITTPRDLFIDDKSELVSRSEGLHAVWETRKVRTSVALRKLFPRPSFLPAKVEISLSKHVLVDSPDTPTYELPHLHAEAMIYTQASGHRRVLIKPASQCAEKCTSMLVIMEPGDSLLVAEQMWKVFIAGKGTDPSVGYIMPIST